MLREQEAMWMVEVGSSAANLLEDGSTGQRAQRRRRRVEHIELQRRSTTMEGDGAEQRWRSMAQLNVVAEGTWLYPPAVLVGGGGAAVWC